MELSSMNSGAVIILVDAIRGHVAFAQGSDDLAVVREHLSKALEGLDVLAKSAVRAAGSPE
jgi:hypothetical protein